MTNRGFSHVPSRPGCSISKKVWGRCIMMNISHLATPTSSSRTVKIQEDINIYRISLLWSLHHSKSRIQFLINMVILMVDCVRCAYSIGVAAVPDFLQNVWLASVSRSSLSDIRWDRQLPVGAKTLRNENPFCLRCVVEPFVIEKQ